MANITIPDLPLAVSLDGTEEFEIVQPAGSGGTSKRTTLSALSSYTTTPASIKLPCLVATTADITLSGLQTINGVVLVDADRVLVWQQTDQTTNGLYTASAGAWTRTADADVSAELVRGTRVLVISGTVNSNTMFTVTTLDPIVLGTSNIAFTNNTSIPWVQAGTSAVATTVQAKLREIVNVLDFGADPTGVADSAAAFTAAIAALPTGGACLYLPAGTYKLASVISLTKTLRIAGDNRDSVVLNTTSATAAVFDIQNSATELSGFTINTTVPRTDSSPFIKVTGGSNSIIRDVNMNAPSLGILLQGGIGFTYLEDIFISDLKVATGVGVKCTGGSGLYATQVSVGGAGLVPTNQPLAGFDLSECGAGVLNACQTLVCGAGILFAPSGATAGTSVFVIGTFCDTCTYGLDIRPSNSSSVATLQFTSCWFATAQQSGIRIQPVNSAVVGDITFVNCTVGSNGVASGAAGIQIGGGAGSVGSIKVEGTTVYANHGDGIAIGAGANQVIITGNILGSPSFPNNLTLSLAGDCANVFVHENDFCDNIATKVSITSTGANIDIDNNLGYEVVLPAVTISADQNNYAPTKLLKAIIPLASDAARNITGLANPGKGGRWTFRGTGSFQIQFQNQSGASSAANRFSIPAATALEPGGTLIAVVDNENTRWKIQGQPNSLLLSVLAQVSAATNTIPYFPTSTTAGVATVSSNLGLSGNVLGSSTGTACTFNVGTSGTALGRLDTANTWSTTQTFTVAPVFTDASATRTALGLAIGTNVEAWDADLDALAALSGTNTIYYRSAANTWTAVTVSTNLGFSGGVLGSSTGTACTFNTGTSGTALGRLDTANTWSLAQTFTAAPVFTDASGSRTALGLGTAATQNTGTSGANLPFLNGTNTWAGAQTFTLAPVFTDASGSRTALGLGTAATQSTGTSGATLPFLNGTNTWAAVQTFTLAPVFTDASGSRTALGLGTAATQSTGTSGATLPFLNGTNTWAASQTLSAALIYGGVTLSNAVTGTGNMVLSAGPTLTGTLTAATVNASGITTLSSATASTSTSTGALVLSGTSGGLGLAGNVNGGGYLSASGYLKWGASVAFPGSLGGSIGVIDYSGGNIRIFGMGPDASTNAGLLFSSRRSDDSNVVTMLQVFNTGGVNIGAPAGGDKGIGTLNCQGSVYSNNVVLACFGIEHLVDGMIDLPKWDGYAIANRSPLAHEFNAMLEDGFDPRDHRQFIDRMKSDRALPMMPTQKTWVKGGHSLDELGMRTWLATELLASAFAGHVAETEKRLKALGV